MQFQEFDVVKVITLEKPDRQFEDSSSAMREPQVGDTGAVVHVFPDARMYTVECVASDGMTIWVADFVPQELALVVDG